MIKPIWVFVAGLIGLVTLAAAAVDTGNHAIDRGFALLILGALLISPLGWIYYLWFGAGPIIVLIKSWYEKGISFNFKEKVRIKVWRKCLLIAAIPGMVCPVFYVLSFQPNPIATISIGSIYFWSILALWLSLLTDWVDASGNFSLSKIWSFGRTVILGKG